METRGPSGHKDYRDLHVWRESLLYATEVYTATSGFPAQERALCDHVRRATASVATRIAEGQAAFSRVQFLRHLEKANGSLAESHTLLILAEQLGYLSPARLAELEAGHLRVARPLAGLMASLRDSGGAAS